MGRLEDGVWITENRVGVASSSGEFEREASTIREWVRRDGSTVFRPEAGRYQLYVSYACPWAHRTLLFRKLKGLEHAIGLTIVQPVLSDQGWGLEPSAAREPGLPTARHLWELYGATDSTFTGRATVPVLWDRNTSRIVNNESADIIRMLNSEFGAIAQNDVDFYPDDLAEEIDELNDFVYDRVNNGVYRCGFASTQEAYDKAFRRLFDALDVLESRLRKNRYLLGDRLTETDWRFWTTLVRFDPVYHGHFKCNERRMSDFTSIFGYLRELYQMPGVAETVDLEHIKQHYYRSHPSLNPTGIVPAGPKMTYLSWPHSRGDDVGSESEGTHG